MSRRRTRRCRAPGTTTITIGRGSYRIGWDSDSGLLRATPRRGEVDVTGDRRHRRALYASVPAATRILAESTKALLARRPSRGELRRWAAVEAFAEMLRAGLARREAAREIVHGAAELRRRRRNGQARPRLFYLGPVTISLGDLVDDKIYHTIALTPSRRKRGRQAAMCRRARARVKR